MTALVGPSRVARFTAAYLVVFLAFSAARGDGRIVAYLIVVGALALALRRAHRLVPFSPVLCGALSVCGLLHVIGGLLPSPSEGATVFYETWLIPEVLKYDQLVHFTTSAVLTAALWRMCDHWTDPERCGPWARALLAVLAALGWGALNEGFEFLSSLRFTTYVGGLDNAGWDLVFNAFGAATAGSYLALSSPRLPRSLDDARSKAPASNS